MKFPRICRRKTCLILVLFAAEALVAMSPLKSTGWFGSHDSVWHLDRLFAVTQEMRSGDYYPRWLSTACFGKGLPALNFYAPAFYLVTGWLHLAGIPLVAALKIMIFAAFFGGSLGMYLWIRNSCNESGALIAASIYMFLPYHFLDLYVRGAFPEFMALALLPFLFHGIDISLGCQGHFKGVFLVAVTSAAITLTHNLSALMVAPFALLMFAWRTRTWDTPWRTIVAAASGPILGAGLSAFYWLPVLAETRHLDRFTETLTSGYLGYDQHFVNPAQWFSSAWSFGFSGPGQVDRMGFQLGYAMLTIAAIAAAALFSSDKANRNFGFITLALGALGLFLTTAASSLLYELIPGLQFIQFPWRFLGVATLFFAAFTGLSTASALTGRFSKILLGAAILLCLVFSIRQREVRQTAEDLDHLETMKLKENTIGILGSRNEFHPRWVPTYAPFQSVFDPVIGVDTSTHVTDIAIKGATMSFNVAKMDGAPITISWFYFPGWKAEVDGRPETVTAVGKGLRRGFVSVPVPIGRHTVRLWFSTTWPRMLGWLIAGMTSTIMAIMAAFILRGRKGLTLNVICVHE